ncbi:MAG: hypothetical protein JOZ35_11595 [Hyphomicrobiales bacterium]|nr:hypothetical protein [Hyphomicrobiales bacterium]
MPGAGAAVTLQHLNTQLALGQPIDLSQHAQAVSAMMCVASRLVGADLTPRITQAHTVAHQPADFGIWVVLIYCQNRVACSQLDPLDTPVAEEAGATDEEDVGSFAPKCRECGIDLADGAGVAYLDLQPHGASGCFHISQCRVGGRSIGRIDEHGK